MKMNDFAGAVKNKPNQTQFIVSLSNLPVVSLSNLPVVSLPALSKVEVSNLFQYKKSGFKSKLLIFDHLTLLHLCTYHLRAYVNFSIFSHLTRCPNDELIHPPLPR
jgi:hypothetical protein